MAEKIKIAKRLCAQGFRTLLLALCGSLPATAASVDLKAFADCISASGAKYYAAYWCPYCKKQNAMFDKDWVFLPYVECSARPGRKQLSRCSHIDGYPTWIFADGTRRSSVLSYQQLESYTGCKLEENNRFID